MKKVLVFGAFNILHPGHIRLLRFAKGCGDCLIVAVQSDRKSGKAAYIKEDLRLEAVLSNIYVDEAFITDEEPLELVGRLRPDILVKGNEHEEKDNPEISVLEEYGGELIFDSGISVFSSIDLLQKELTNYSSDSLFELPTGYLNRHNIISSCLVKRIDKFRKLKILVVGDLIMDEYVICDPLGMSREDPSIVVAPIDKKLFLGGAGVVSAHAANLGAHVDFVSVAGEDAIKDSAMKLLKGVGVHPYLIIDSHRPTTLKKRYRSQGKTLLKVSYLHQNDISRKLQNQFYGVVKEVILGADLVIFSDFNYGCLPDSLVEQINKVIRSRGIYSVADSQSSSQVGDVSRFKGVGLLTPTEHEARIAMRDYNSGLVVLAESLRRKARPENILLKLGEEGVLIHAGSKCDDGYLTDKIPALSNKPKDVSGAGDSMLITTAMALKAGGTIWEAALLGSIAAGIQVNKTGNIPLEISELKSAILK